MTHSVLPLTPNFVRQTATTALFSNTFPKEPKILSKIPMREFLEKKGYTAHFNSDVSFVELEGGAQAVLKIVNPENTFEVIAEVVAYRAACFLGLDFVPPTLLYAENGQVGSIQAYVEPLYDLMKAGTYEDISKQVSHDVWANIQIFYFVFGQWDPDPSNMIATKHGNGVRLALIDNAAMGYLQKVRYGEHPFVLYFENVADVAAEEISFPFEKVQTLPSDTAVWKEQFGALLSEEQINKLCQLRWHDIPFVFWKGHLWRQFQFGTPAYTTLYPPKTMDALQQLTLQNVKEFFHNDIGFQFPDEYFTDILERRDQIVQAYSKT
jgi:hypothetical protein